MVSHTVCAWVSSQPHRTSQVSSFVGNEAKRNTNFAVTATHNNAIDNYCNITNMSIAWGTHSVCTLSRKQIDAVLQIQAGEGPSR